MVSIRCSHYVEGDRPYPYLYTALGHAMGDRHRLGVDFAS